MGMPLLQNGCRIRIPVRQPGHKNAGQGDAGHRDALPIGFWVVAASLCGEKGTGMPCLQLRSKYLLHTALVNNNTI
jgi:hypothetical protein